MEEAYSSETVRIYQTKRSHQYTLIFVIKIILRTSFLETSFKVFVLFASCYVSILIMVDIFTVYVTFFILFTLHVSTLMGQHQVLTVVKASRLERTVLFSRKQESEF
jgi:hypothetical protein